MDGWSTGGVSHIIRFGSEAAQLDDMYKDVPVASYRLFEFETISPLMELGL